MNFEDIMQLLAIAKNKLVDKRIDENQNNILKVIQEKYDIYDGLSSVLFNYKMQENEISDPMFKIADEQVQQCKISYKLKLDQLNCQFIFQKLEDKIQKEQKQTENQQLIYNENCQKYCPEEEIEPINNEITKQMVNLIYGNQKIFLENQYHVQKSNNILQLANNEGKSLENQENALKRNNSQELATNNEDINLKRYTNIKVEEANKINKFRQQMINLQKSIKNKNFKASESENKSKEIITSKEINNTFTNISNQQYNRFGYKRPYCKNYNTDLQKVQGENNNNIQNTQQQNEFKTAGQLLEEELKNNNQKIQHTLQNYHVQQQVSNQNECNNNQSKLKQKFIPPYKKDNNEVNNQINKQAKLIMQIDQKNQNVNSDRISEEFPGIEQKMVDMIMVEIAQRSKTYWNDIAGLDFAKKQIHEIIIWPLLQPQLFKGIRSPPKGLLLFGPPGTGKTMIGRAIANESGSTFFSISASSLTSKWIGEGEKMVKALFQIAIAMQPSVIFIDEIDSLLCTRIENENEASRRMKTEFMLQLEGTKTQAEDRLLFIGATNRPQELDDAIRRRFVKRLYIPLPNQHARGQLISNIISSEKSFGNKIELSEFEITEIINKTIGYSGADIRNLFSEASYYPIREIDLAKISKDGAFDVQLLRNIGFKDVLNALQLVKASVSRDSIQQYIDWNTQYGTFQFSNDELNN